MSLTAAFYLDPVRDIYEVESTFRHIMKFDMLTKARHSQYILFCSFSSTFLEANGL